MARSLLRDLVAVEVTSAFTASGVRSILLKGAAVASWLYDDGALRWYSDIDLLVAPSDVDRAESVLGDLGFAPAKAGWSVHELDAHAHPWRRGQETVDLHRRLDGIGCAPETAWPILVGNTEPLRIGGGTVEVLAKPGRALHLALHAAQDGPVVSKAHEDLRRAVARVPEQTWREAADLARSLGAEDSMAAGLRLDPATAPLCGRLGLPGPHGLRSTLLAQGAPRSAYCVAEALSADSWQTVVGRLARRAVPTKAWMRSRYPFADRGPVALATAYVWRAVTAGRRAPAAFAAVARARR